MKRILTGLLSLLPLAFWSAQAQTLTTLHTFADSDGAYPRASLVDASNGTFYGSTYYGGFAAPEVLAGVLFRISSNETYNVLAEFTQNNGDSPWGGLIWGPDGLLYGTTEGGAVNNASGGFGTIFTLKTNGTLNTLYEFPGAPGGAAPIGTLALGADGHFYGTTAGNNVDQNIVGYGSVFTFAANSTPVTLYSFTGDTNGGLPWGGVAQGRDGNFYGTTSAYGTNQCGTVFRITTNGTLTTLHEFSGVIDGGIPYSTLVLGTNGNFYGTAAYGGTNADGILNGSGTVFQITTNGLLTTLHYFTGGADGARPMAGLKLAADGTFYGSTSSGGLLPGGSGYGTLFRISTKGDFSTVYAFTGGNDGADPWDAPLPAGDGNLYGTTMNGGASGFGTVFALRFPTSNLTGLLEISLSPPAAVTAGAQWQLDGGPFQSATMIVTNISAGTHTVAFRTINNWITPSAQTVSIGTNAAAVVAGIYGNNPGFVLETNTDNTLIIVGYLGSNATVNIPSMIDGLLVTTIGINAFEGDTNMTSVTIPGSVTSIEEDAFDSTGLTSLTIPGTVANIAKFAFNTCTHLTNLTLADGISTIGDNAFYLCKGLTNVNIPASVSSIGIAPFELSSSLLTITVDTNNPYCSSADGVLFSKFPSTLIEFPGGRFGFYTVPLGVTSIGEDAFQWCFNIYGVIISDSVTTIEDYAFSVCSVSSVVIPNSVTSIGNNAFHNSVLLNLSLPSSLVYIGNNAFDYSGGLTSVTIPPSVASLGQGAFAGCNNLTNVCFQGNAPTDGGSIFDQDTALPSVYYVDGTSGWGSSFSGVNTKPCPQCAKSPVGSLQVMIYPQAATTAGAKWQVDGGALQKSGTTLAGLSVGYQDVSFTPVSGFFAPADQFLYVGTGPTTVIYETYAQGNPKLSSNLPKSGQNVSNSVLPVTWTASDAVPVTALYFLLNGSVWTPATMATSWTTWTASLILKPGTNTLLSYAVDATGAYSKTNLNSFNYIVAAPLVLHTNGNGTVLPKVSGASLAINTDYTLTATPAKNWIFSNWVATGSETFLSNTAVLKFTMQSNLTLTANFVTNVFLAAQGTYNGLFAVENAPRQQTNSGAFTFTVTSAGLISGKLTFGTNTPSLTGQFNPAGAAIITTPRKGLSTLPTTLQLDFANQSVQGTVSDGSFLASLSGDRALFSSTHPATLYQGQYTFIIPGANDPTVGPFGTSYGTVTVAPAGTITFAGSLADGTAIGPITSMVSRDGYWPFYVPLYGGAGSLWGWNLFTNQTLIPAPSLSWINATNPAKTALYKAGFTNQAAFLVSSPFHAGNEPLLFLTNGQVILDSSGGTFALTNQIVLASNNTITLIRLAQAPENTNKLVLTINKTTGVLTGAFANPLNPKQTLAITGVLLQSQTNAAGYFIGTNQGGSFTIQQP